MIEINSISRQETIRYLGDRKVELNSTMESLLTECEKELLAVINPRYLYKIITPETSLLQGESIKEHLQGCEKAVIMCATSGVEVDKLIRRAQICDMAKAVVFDAMGSVVVEEICNKVDELVAQEFSEYYTTWRFSPGYGDYPIQLQKDFLQLLDAPRKIGLCTNDSYILTPMKSVTAIIGLSKKPIEKKRRGCGKCNLMKTCKFRKAGTRCEL